MIQEEHEDRRTRRTRQALKSAFVELILENSYDSVTILDVTIERITIEGLFINILRVKRLCLRKYMMNFYRV